MFKPVLATAAALAAIVAPVPAAAKTAAHAWQVGADSVHLYYPDLDMNSAAGRQTLLARIERAATGLCRDMVDERACVADTLAQTSRMPQASALRLAMTERDGVRLAAR